MIWQRKRLRSPDEPRKAKEYGYPKRLATRIASDENSKSLRRIVAYTAVIALITVWLDFVYPRPICSREYRERIGPLSVSPPHKNTAQCQSALERNISIAGITNTTIPTDNKKKPYFVLHIGPSKTGTTTLQKESIRLQEYLEQDNNVYLGRYASRSARQPARMAELLSNDGCLQEVSKLFNGNSSSTIIPKCWKERTYRIREYNTNHTNIIVSDEHYSYERQLAHVCNDPQYWSTLRQALFVDWNLIVVVTYRRYAEWILSVAKEVNQKLCHNPSHPSAQWDGQRCWSLWQLIETYLDTTGGDAFSYMNVDTTSLAYADVPVRILNLHASSSLMTTLYCDVIRNSPNTCRKLQENATTNKIMENVQSVMTTVYNDIVFEASRAGLLQSEEMREKIRQDFTMEVAKEGDSMGLQMLDLPLLCPRRSDLNRLLRKSLNLERLVIGSDREDEHQRDFWRLANEKKAFCGVDTARLLSGKTSWMEVMAHLRRMAGQKSFGMIA